MTDSRVTTTPSLPGSGGGGGGEGANYLIISLAVGIPCGLIIIALISAIVLMFYLTCKTPSDAEEAEYRHRRFQGISLEQQRHARSNRKKKKRVARRRESEISGKFSPRISRTPSSLSASARHNPFGLQEWQIRMYGGAMPGRGGGGGGDRSPDTEEVELSGDDDYLQRSHITGAINPLAVQGQDHDPGYDTPPQHKSKKPHSHPPPPPPKRRQPPSSTHKSSSPSDDDDEIEDSSSSDDSMNPYD